MARRLKEMIVRDLEDFLGGVRNAVMVDISTLNAEDNLDYRNLLRKEGVTVNVVKNSLARRVLAGQGYDFPEESLSGPTAILTSEGDAITTSKLVADWRKSKKKKVPLKGGLLEGEVLGPEDAEKLIDMPSVQETQQMLVSVIAAPLSELVGITNNILSGVPAVVQSIADMPQVTREAIRDALDALDRGEPVLQVFGGET